MGKDTKMLEKSLNYWNRKLKLKFARDSLLIEIMTFFLMLEDGWIVGGCTQPNLTVYSFLFSHHTTLVVDNGLVSAAGQVNRKGNSMLEKSHN